jgi:hypothetical protein
MGVKKYDKPRNPNGRGGFKKGESGNPQGLAIITPDLRAAKKYTRELIDRTLLAMVGMTNAQLTELMNNPGSTQLELLVATVLKKGIEYGCQSRLGFLLDRIVGKVRDAQPAIPFPDSNVETIDIQPVATGERTVVYEVEMSEAGKFKHSRPQLAVVRDEK